MRGWLYPEASVPSDNLEEVTPGGKLHDNSQMICRQEYAPELDNVWVAQVAVAQDFALGIHRIQVRLRPETQVKGAAT